MPRDIISHSQQAAFDAYRAAVSERADRMRRDRRAAAYIAAKLAERDERQARKTRRQVNMFCAAIVGIGAASIIVQVW